jgi:hypothetical protein
MSYDQIGSNPFFLNYLTPYNYISWNLFTDIYYMIYFNRKREGTRNNNNTHDVPFIKKRFDTVAFILLATFSLAMSQTAFAQTTLSTTQQQEANDETTAYEIATDRPFSSTPDVIPEHIKQMLTSARLVVPPSSPP